MKLTACKRCSKTDVYWIQDFRGKWTLIESADGSQHRCQDGQIKAVKCKYCPADDLHWAEDNTTGRNKMVLTESYGLPHACQERIDFFAKEKQAKKDQYEFVKKTLESIPDGNCPTCNGRGNDANYNTCKTCRGYCRISKAAKKQILRTVRIEIWPGLANSEFDRYGF